ncbi:MAG: nuclear transport factor 2 family protein [Akkermansiaceae bacterium]|nr:nuclear transport factor 2 family protein [Akkermansiaceae bacterium]
MNIRQFFGHASDLAAIRSMLLRYKAAIDHGDVGIVMACHADHAEISAISLDSVYTGKNQVRQFFENLFSPAVKEDQSKPPTDTHICIHGQTAVLVMLHEMRLLKPEPHILHCRISLTLIREKNEWRILHSHLSASRETFLDVGDARH